MKFLLCSIGFLLACFPKSDAQHHPSLNQQLKSYEVKFKNLMATRGLSYNEGKVNQAKLEDVVRKFSEDPYEQPQPGFGLLFYHFENDTLYHWLFNHEQLEATASLPLKVDSLITLENTLKFSLSIDELLADKRAVYQNKNKKYRLRTYQSNPVISAILFPEAIQKKLVGKRHLVILPILNLSSFPFALLRPWGEKKGTLIDSMSYSFAHNFTQFFQSVERNTMDDGNYRLVKNEIQFQLKQPIVCGNPAFTDACTQRLKPLAGAEKEATQVASTLKVPVWLGAAARKDSVLKKMTQSSFVYLATHGWADPAAPLDSSFIALSQPGGCGFVTPREIQSLDLEQKPIVILSACQTGLGMIHDAGIVGLARGFLKAGAQSVVMSLWDVNDIETQKLMTLFAEELQVPHLFFPAEHWRQAVLKYKGTLKGDPLNWSAFQLFGVPYLLRGAVSVNGN